MLLLWLESLINSLLLISIAQWDVLTIFLLVTLKTNKHNLLLTIVFCCYNLLDLPWEKFLQVWVTFFPSSWEQEYCVEKRLYKFEALGREFVTFSRHYSCLRELGKIFFLTCDGFFREEKIEVLTKQSQQVRNNKEN